MTEIPDDIILEILSFLPLKFLFRFKHLNKRFEQLISCPTFQNRRAVLRSFTGYECILHRILPPVFSTYLTIELPSPSRRRSVENSYSSVRNIADYCDMPLLLASSGGFLLLRLFVLVKEGMQPFQYPKRFRHRFIFCLFNPATGAYQIIPKFPTGVSGYGLALIPNVVVSKKHFSYKLVLPICFKHPDDNVKFWIFESESKSWHEGRTNLNSFKRILPKHEGAYYLNDSLYWLGLEGLRSKILVFNVKSEVAEIINLPEAIPEVNQVHELSLNLGSVRDKLALMTVDSNNNFLLWIYDFIHHTWKIDRIFENRISLSWNFPVFCDGSQLISANISNQEEGAAIVRIRGNSTENITNIPLWFNSSTFTHFLATLTEIPDCQYLINGLKGMKDHISDEELALKRHFQNLLFITKCSFLE